MSLTSELYGTRHNGNSHGDVFTLPQVVEFMLDLIGYTSDKDLSKFKILEPSFGNGDFLLEIKRRIIQSSQRYNFNASEIMCENVYGCEIDELKYRHCIDALQAGMPHFMPVNLKNEDFLFSSWDTEFDYIVGNPPYVRYENIPDGTRKAYKAKFKAFHYRCDLYILFYEQCLNNLSVNGRHCFICSNRWLKNEYGKKLRTIVSTSYNLEYVIDVERLEAFKESVLAYPSITVISNTGTCCDTKVATIQRLQDLKLPMQIASKRICDIKNWDDIFLAEDVSGFDFIENQGFCTGIGVATGADKLFISPDLKGMVEDELLLPIVNAKDLTGNEFKWHGSYLLNPYNPDGSLIDLNKYSKARQYLEKFRVSLERRHIVKNGRSWYSLIDRVKPHIKSQPKILLPDISGNRVIFVDEGFFYPAHNIYYITGNTKEELDILAAMFMSDFVRNQVESISTKMNGGIPRWQSQSIKRLRVPRISLISENTRCKLIDAYRECNFREINIIMDDIVKSQTGDHSLCGRKNVPKSLFDYEFPGISMW